ncbi:uncharacterized protein N7518_002940 [Penicillium psychrosexuale]|uniref:uncharacterized protein n=1 Tax=Penicillium psychrosexuale TaxID=1002107 RepID=UPI002544E6E9|nr:uncharacterized protein N7518_002940 [Penicillium psychrosexuale]KAJ5800872.1 hypothetical protein N7518_002940 [Penicillium psychrosexuale]
MIDAIRHDDTKFAEALLSHGLPLHPDYALEAAKWKATNVLEVLLKNGFDINKPISDGQLPVLGHIAQDQDMVLWLLRHGADLNQTCLIDLTPLSYAVHYAPISNIKLFLDNGGDTQQGQLLFHALNREAEVIEVLTLLLKEGAPLNGTLYQNHPLSRSLYAFMGLGTILHKAAKLGKVDVVRFLVCEGVDLSIKDANGNTALDCARERGKIEVVPLLEGSTDH